MKLSEFFTDFQVVRLEISDDVLIDDLVFGKIEQANGKIYVSDGNALYIFDQSGKILSEHKLIYGGQSISLTGDKYVLYLGHSIRDKTSNKIHIINTDGQTEA
jgi:outer membrane protein assembly factor BamB